MIFLDFNIRAEGINRIKSPEYHVWPQLWPIIVAGFIMILILWFFSPAKITFFPLVPENVLWTGLVLFMLLLYTIMVLVKRIKWERE